MVRVALFLIIATLRAQQGYVNLWIIDSSLKQRKRENGENKRKRTPCYLLELGSRRRMALSSCTCSPGKRDAGRRDSASDDDVEADPTTIWSNERLLTHRLPLLTTRWSAVAAALICCSKNWGFSCFHFNFSSITTSIAITSKGIWCYCVDICEK